ncbi:DUF171-domain-containing protein, partial [Rhizodiscina lignyota]
DTTKPTAIFQAPGKGRHYTVSIALTGSIIANAQNHELKTALAGQIARAAAVFCVDEIVVFNDGQSHSRDEHHGRHQHQENRFNNNDAQAEDEHTGWSDPDHFLVHLLSYLECPPHLRRRLFPIHPNLRTAGSLPSLDMPHHLRQHEWCEYREGVTLPPTSQNQQRTVVDVGLKTTVEMDTLIKPNTRVTHKLPAQPPRKDDSSPLKAEIVDPTTPRTEAGFYWGYDVRSAPSLSSVFTECPFEGGYDVSIGTSERGNVLSSVLPLDLVSSRHAKDFDDNALHRLPDSFTHLLLVFGGVAGLEAAAAADEDLARQGVKPESVSELFDAWVNVCPGQGSRTIRTEEAVWLGLAAFR